MLAAQFLAVSLFDQGASALTVLATAFFVNVRHVLNGSALSAKLEGMTRGRLAWVAAELTDESFVMASRAAWARGGLSFPFVAGLNGTAQASWVTGSLVGGAGGGLLGDPLRFGLDFALVAMFLGLLALRVHGLRELGVAVAAAAVSLALWLAGMGSWAVVPATLAASALGLLLDRSAAVPHETEGLGLPHLLRQEDSGGGNE